jgi:membrane protease YdiL (CAAX protease family)
VRPNCTLKLNRGNVLDIVPLLRRSFSFALIVALVLAVVTALIAAPVAAIGLAAAGFRFPFPRIFDRTIMVALLAALALLARPLKLLELLRQGFSNVVIGMWDALNGMILAAAAMAIIFALGSVAGANVHLLSIAESALRYLPAAVLIAAIEEGFFRAFLLAGVENEFGSLTALFVSSAIFAMVHVVRSPARYYLTRFDPMAGITNIAGYAERVVKPEMGAPLLGLFLLGLVLGEAFVLSRRAYCSLGLHVGLVLSTKTWRVAVSGTIPPWLSRSGPFGLIAAPTAWALAPIMLLMLPIMLRSNGPGSGQLNCKRAPYRAGECDSADESTGTGSGGGARSPR